MEKQDVLPFNWLGILGTMKLCPSGRLSSTLKSMTANLIIPIRADYTNRHWQEIGIQGDCPYHFTEDELKSYAVDAEGWNEVQDFFDSIEDLVKRDS